MLYFQVYLIILISNDQYLNFQFFYDVYYRNIIERWDEPLPYKRVSYSFSKLFYLYPFDFLVQQFR